MQTPSPQYRLYKLSEFPNIQRWAQELKELFQAKRPDVSDWLTLGRGVVMISPREDATVGLLEQIADEAKIPLLRTSEEELISSTAVGTIPTAWEGALIFIPAGEWSGDSNDSKYSQLQEKLRAFLSNSSNDCRFVLVTSVNAYMEIGENLRQLGALDRRFFLPELSMMQIGESFLNDLGIASCDESLTNNLAKVGRIIGAIFDSPRQQGLLKIALMRLAHREKRQLCMHDLINFSTNGTYEFAGERLSKSKALQQRVAFHEAGHVLVAMVDSKGQNIPEYASIISNHMAHGMVVESYLNGEEYLETFQMALQSIRIYLAGRAAEEVIYGRDLVGRRSANTDLANATQNAKNLVARCGFSSSTEPNSHFDNLAVIGENSTKSEDELVEWHARKLLAKQYEVALKTIIENRPLLEKIAVKLLDAKVLFQEDLEALYQEAGYSLFRGHRPKLLRPPRTSSD